MAGDGKDTDDIKIPMLFLFSKEGSIILDAIREHEEVEVLLSDKARDRGNSRHCCASPVSPGAKVLTKVAQAFFFIFSWLVKQVKILENGLEFLSWK